MIIGIQYRNEHQAAYICFKFTGSSKKLFTACCAAALLGAMACSAFPKSSEIEYSL
jgi:hypothetical protein